MTVRNVLSFFRRKRKALVSSVASPCRPLHTDWNTNKDWFHYTRGRFLINEAHELAIRHVEFDMNELARCAAESLGLAPTQCTRVEKFPDGMYNKTFLFTMDDGSQVVGKVPNPNAGKAHYTTASEVATMDFARNELSTPVPKVLSWSSKAQKNRVGAEYIIMEKVAGVQLHEVWPNMDIKERFEVAKSISRFQKAWMSASFSHYGSLYYSSDLNKSEGSTAKDSRFAVGPSAGREFLDDGRRDVDFDRGPWSSVEEYKSAIGRREIACVQNIGELPPSPLALYGPGTYSRSRSKKTAALKSYLCLLPYLLPTDSSISSAFLWHPDLHTENIFVNPEKRSEVLGIIDWQSAEVLPLFDHARQPYFLDYDGPQSVGIDAPAFPENFAQLEPAEKAWAQDLYLKQSLCALSRRFTYQTNPTLFHAMEFRQTTSFDMMLFAQNLLIDGEALYQSNCLDLEKEWASLPGVQAFETPPFPLQFSAEEITAIEEDASGAIDGMQLMRDLKESLGDLWPEKGVVKPEEYEQVKERLQQAKSEIIDRLADSEAKRTEWEKIWPFDS